MKCIVPGPNVKVLGRAIHSLAKLGDELYMESTEKELFFRTVNSSKTAYASYSFSSNFFLYYCTETNGQSGPSCQISIRSALGVFKTPMTLERLIDSMQIEFNSHCDNVVFIIKYKKGVVKTFITPVIECEALEAYYAKDVTPNSITIQPRIVQEILTNFQEHQEEITWKVTKNNLIVKNYSESESESDGLRTEIVVNKNEFDNYKIESETEVTFCLRELRAVLLFSDSVALPLTANFSAGSKPIVFVIKSDIFEVSIVVSTLSDEDKCESMDDVTAPSTSTNVNTDSNTNATDFLSQENIEDDLNDVNVDADLLNNFDVNVNADLLNDGNINAELLNEINDDADAFINDVNIDASPEPVKSKSLLQSGKLHHVFHRFFNSEENDVKKMPGYDVILASDSDSDV